MGVSFKRCLRWLPWSLLLMCRYSSAQGGCNPTPPSFGGGGVGTDGAGIPGIPVPDSVLEPQIGGRNAPAWSVFSATQVQSHGLWCRVSMNSNAGMGSNIGDFYYPTGNESAADGFALTPNLFSNSSGSPPYVSLKCTNQIALVVDGDVTNNQGIVKCNTTIPNLDRDANYWVVYSDALYNNYTGPTVDPNMTLSVVSSRDADPNVTITFFLTVSFGPPSHIQCSNGLTQVISVRGIHSDVTYDVIRSHYINSSLPDMTRVTVKLPPQPREGRTYTCTVTVEGRTNIATGNYVPVTMGTGSSTTTITVAGTPTGVTVIRTGLTSARVSWTAPSPAPAGYEVFYQEKTEAGNITINTSESLGNTSKTELILTEMTLGEIYSIFVVAYEAEGAPVLPSAHSNTVTASFAIPQLTALVFTPTISSVMVSWSAPEVAAENYILSYLCQLECSMLSSAREDEEELEGDAADYVISQLDLGSTCTVNLTALYGNISSNTVTSSTSTLSAAPIGAPRGLAGKLVGRRSLSLVWETVPCPDQRGAITGYKLRYSNGTFIVSTTGEGSREHLITGLTPFTSYSVQVAAVNDGGTGPYSPPLTLETLQDVPGPVSGLSTTPEVIQLTILWNPPSEPNGRITAYQIRYRISDREISIIDTSATRHTLEGFKPDTVVTFSITAYTIEGPGENVTFQTSTGSVPQVSQVNVEVLNATAVRLFWSPINLSVVHHYTIYYTLLRRGRQSESGTVNITAGSSSGVVGGLMTGEQYQFSVSVTVSGGGQYYTGPVSDPTDPVTVAAPPLFSTVTLSITAVGWGLVLLLGIVIILAIIVLLIKNLKPKNKVANQIDESELTNHEDMKNRMRPDRLTVISM